jgi:low affinity Fe/Cu permease
MHIKIDELIRVTQKARNVLLDLEELDDTTLDLLRKDYGELARKANSQTRTSDTRRGGAGEACRRHVAKEQAKR